MNCCIQNSPVPFLPSHSSNSLPDIAGTRKTLQSLTLKAEGAPHIPNHCSRRLRILQGVLQRLGAGPAHPPHTVRSGTSRVSAHSSLGRSTPVRKPKKITPDLPDAPDWSIAPESVLDTRQNQRQSVTSGSFRRLIFSSTGRISFTSHNIFSIPFSTSYQPQFPSSTFASSISRFTDSHILRALLTPQSTPLHFLADKSSLGIYHLAHKSQPPRVAASNIISALVPI
jgi:hypothetical protein